MGNHISSPHGSPATGKVILPDGSIREFNEPITVAELMLEHPQQVVIELEEAVGHQKREWPTPLPADKKLVVNNTYFLVPLRRGKPIHLSHQEARLILLRASQALRSKTMVSSSKLLPLMTSIWPQGSSIEDSRYKTVVCVEEPLASEERDDMEDDDGIEGLEVMERKEYLKRKYSPKGWKPSLDTIEEIKKYETSEDLNWVSLAIKVGKRLEYKGLVWG